MNTDDDLKTSVRIVGEAQVDEFRALCALLGRRPHQLAADMVLDAIRAYRDDPDVAEAVGKMVAARDAHRAREALIVRGRGHLTLMRGDG